MSIDTNIIRGPGSRAPAGERWAGRSSIGFGPTSFTFREQWDSGAYLNGLHRGWLDCPLPLKPISESALLTRSGFCLFPFAIIRIPRSLGQVAMFCQLGSHGKEASVAVTLETTTHLTSRS
jgi:hypothetical protein